jgi:hypothetical protein
LKNLPWKPLLKKVGFKNKEDGFPKSFFAVSQLRPPWWLIKEKWRF